MERKMGFRSIKFAQSILIIFITDRDKNPTKIESHEQKTVLIKKM